MKVLQLIILVLLCTVGKYSAAQEKVTIFSQVYCEACSVAKAFFEKENITYTELFIDKSQAAMAYFQRLGGRGTPLIIVNNQQIHGFQEDTFWRLFSKKPQQHSAVYTP